MLGQDYPKQNLKRWIIKG